VVKDLFRLNNNSVNSCRHVAMAKPLFRGAEFLFLTTALSLHSGPFYFHLVRSDVALRSLFITELVMSLAPHRLGILTELFSLPSIEWSSTRSDCG